MHKKNILLALNLDSLPKNFCIHHIDGNSRNNDINNLAVLTFSAHNKIHSHQAWNKGLSINTSKKWRDTINKIQEARNKHYLPILKSYYDLRKSGMSVINIAKKFNRDRNTIYSGIKSYEQFINRRKN